MVDMATWFTADLHLGHANIIRYSSRPFPNADAMNRTLLDLWNATVAESDDVWILGDFAMGDIDQTLSLVAELSGRKLLLAGNHDRCWAGHGRRSEGWTDRYLDAGFAEVHQGERVLAIGDTAVLACHFPYRGDSQARERFRAHRPADAGRWLLHGHVHDRWRQSERMINVGVDAWDYRPVSTEVLAGLVAAGPGFRRPDPTN